MRLPIRVRLTLIFGLLMLVTLGFTGLFLYLKLGVDLTQAIDAGLRTRADTIRAGLSQTGAKSGDQATVLDSDQAFAQIVVSNGSVIRTTSFVGSRPVISPRRLRDISGPRYWQVPVGLPDGETMNARVFALPSPGGRTVIVGTNLEHREAALARLAELMSIGGPVTLALVTAIGWLLAGAALRPVDQMRKEAAAISAGEPGRRLSVAASGDEIQRLGDTLNAMLDRLEEAIQRERRLVDDASHELRTPLGILRTELELALGRARTREELEAALRSASEESDRLSRLAEDLLTLARSDGGRLPVRKERVRLEELAGRAVATFEGRAAAAGLRIQLDVPPSATAELDEVRARQALDNLLDNALRHTEAGGRVTVSVTQDVTATIIAVRDSGEGFPDDFLPRIFEHFARSDSARSRHSGGAGLGLAIVKAVAESHGGRVSACNCPQGGAIVSLSLPIPTATT
ncbi:ATP-binding protein [soil metagenome]